MSHVTRMLVVFFVLAGAFLLPAAAHAAVHTVVPGDTLYAISRNYGISLESLMGANGIQDSLIYPGQQIYIPENYPGEASPNATGVEQADGLDYTVQNGDSLYLIGQRFGVSYQEIMASNGLADYTIYPGMILSIPADPAVSGAAAGQSAPQVSRGGYFQRPAPADVDLLARLITAEADGEPYEGKVAVGAVVLNRVDDPKFPNSISDVIYQYDNGTYQFEPVMNNWINRPASAESINAAKDALNGVDPTNGAVYFFASYIKNSWLWARPLSKVIGSVVFTY